ncbi:MAG: GTPase ObgE [Chloroflexota bacterium]
MFDRVKVFVKAGDGGDGSHHMRRELYIPRGGPDGGDGGRGASVYVEADPQLTTLGSYAHKKHFKGTSGGIGLKQKQHGKSGDDLILKVPPGTLVRLAEADELLADLVEPGQRVMVARGGRGGLGNTHFATATHQRPMMAQKGEPGEERWIRLELKLIADVGIVGLPNAGKSTLLSVISGARPKIADYPFTTLEPNLGVVQRDDVDFVVADIPGLIEGAHAGAGLGHEFLRHVERTRLLVHLLDGSAGAAQALGAYRQIREELRLYGGRLVELPEVVAVTKLDLPEARDAWLGLREELAALGTTPLAISAVAHQGIDGLVNELARRLASLPPSPPFVDAGEEGYKVFRLSGDDDFEVHRENDEIFTVNGRKVERVVAMTDMANAEALDYLQGQLKRMGVTAALERAGVQAGDVVRIGSHELMWSPGPEPSRPRPR